MVTTAWEPLECQEGELGDREGDDDGEMPWEEIRNRLRLADSRARYFLEFFEKSCEITTSIDAFSKIKGFLGERLVVDFDYRAFCERLALDDVECAEAEAAAAEEESAARRPLELRMLAAIQRDLGAAATLMLQIAVSIARAYSLQMSDWQDINAACGNAVRILPACYCLRRCLPGALNAARQLRFLPTPSEHDNVNPWKSEEGKELFESAHGLSWATVEACTTQDEWLKACFAAALEVLEVNVVESLAIVRLQVHSVSDQRPSDDVPQRTPEPGDIFLWEVESPLAAVMLPGIVIDAEWYELQNEICFIGTLGHVAPLWAY